MWNDARWDALRWHAFATSKYRVVAQVDAVAGGYELRAAGGYHALSSYVFYAAMLRMLHMVACFTHARTCGVRRSRLVAWLVPLR